MPKAFLCDLHLNPILLANDVGHVPENKNQTLLCVSIPLFTWVNCFYSQMQLREGKETICKFVKRSF